MASLSAATPPPAAVVHEWILDSPSQLKLLRAALHQALTGRPYPPDAALQDVPEKMVIVATELATNALRHGLPPTAVQLGRSGDGNPTWVLDVLDHATAEVPEYADGRDPGLGGLGLYLARELALDIGWYVTGNTKHVWAEFPDTRP